MGRVEAELVVFYGGLVVVEVVVAAGAVVVGSERNGYVWYNCTTNQSALSSK